MAEAKNNVIPLSSPVRIDPDSIWPDPIPLASALQPVAKFDHAMVPDGLRDWIIDISDRMNVPAEFVSVPGMVSAATLIGRRVGIRPEVHSDWTEAAILWGPLLVPKVPLNLQP